MDYCDTNILTSFVNRNNLKRKLGSYAYNKFKDRIKGNRSASAEIKSKKINKCIIAREPLINDLGNNAAAVGSVLTYSELKDVKIVSVKGGYKTGKTIYSKTCRRVNHENPFYKKFCENNILKKNLEYSDMNDVMHFGSAMQLKSERFITDNKKDFVPLKEFSNIEVI